MVSLDNILETLQSQSLCKKEKNVEVMKSHHGLQLGAVPWGLGHSDIL